MSAFPTQVTPCYPACSDSSKSGFWHLQEGYSILNVKILSIHRKQETSGPDVSDSGPDTSPFG